MSTAFSVARNIFALIGLAGCALIGALFAFNAAQHWAMRRTERHLGEVHRAEGAQRLQRAVDKASARNQDGAGR